jgi:hypothetical protein
MNVTVNWAQPPYFLMKLGLPRAPKRSYTGKAHKERDPIRSFLWHRQLTLALQDNKSNTNDPTTSAGSAKYKKYNASVSFRVNLT